MQKHYTREDWLNAMKEHLKSIFNNSGYDYPDKIRISCAFPVNTRGSKTTIGQCWTPSLSKDGTYEIFISPEIDEPIEVSGILAHELTHTVVGLEHGHKRAFKRCANSIGLTGKMTATYPTIELANIIKKSIDYLGPYPHKQLTRPIAKQNIRLIKCVCGHCGYTARITKKWITEGLARCPEGHPLLPDII